MLTITVKKLRELINMVPDNTPVYIVAENGEDGLIDMVSLESVNDNDFKSFAVRIDYHV